MSATVREHALLHDDALLLRVEDTVAPLASPWLPLHIGEPRTEARGAPARAAVVDVEALDGSRGHEPVHPHEPPLLHFGGVRVVERAPDTLLLIGASAARGRLGLDARAALIEAPASGAADAAARDVYSMLTLASAFLVGRLDAALVHAGCVVDPNGRAWALVGDSHAGKTTTCVSLVAAGGWRWLADDQIVLRHHEDGGIVVEGWPRRAHLDEGWHSAVVTGRRAATDLRVQWGDRWTARAPFGGMLLPVVHPDATTSLSRATPAAALAALVRQSPWLMADRGAAHAVLTLLRDAAARPAFTLVLGRDVYARGDVLAKHLAPAVASAGAR
jgi:hypothetical protein